MASKKTYEFNTLNTKNKNDNFTPLISVCISVFNLDIRLLLDQLSLIIDDLIVDSIEILVGDDSPNSDFHLTKEEVQKFGITYLPQAKNIGRSRIRNLLATHASGKYLLFLDGDALINNNQFLINYFEAIKQYPHSVILGGTSYETLKPNKHFELRYYYGIQREQISAAIRNSKPYKSFTTFNFCIQRSVFNQIKFDESIRSYGHEDTILGIELKERNIQVFHIDNPLIHNGIDSSVVFIKKTEQSIQNILSLYKQRGGSLLPYSTLLQTMNDLKYFRFFIAILFSRAKPFLRKNLVSSNPSMIIFDLYKLGYLSTIFKKK